jgi:PAS domain S-box-containing protein
VQLAADAGFPEERRFDIQVATSEACANAIEHSPPESEVVLDVLIYQDRLEIRVEGPGQFELPAMAARERAHRGLGLPLMAKLSDHLALYSGPRGGTLVGLTFYRPGFGDEKVDRMTPHSIAALFEEGEFVAAITDTAPVGLFVLDAELRFRWANPAYRQFLEEPYRSQPLEGVFIGDAVPGSEEMGSLDLLRTVSRNGERAFFPEYELVGFARGVTFWRWEALPLERERSEPPYDILVVISEITEQVVQRQRLVDLATEAADRAGQLQSVLDASAVAIWVAHDPECRVITGNRYADQVIMGVVPGGNISRSALPGAADVSYSVWRDARELSPDELPAQIAAATAQAIFDQEFELRFPDGRVVHMLANALPVFDADGMVRGSVTAALDVTERKRSEAELVRLNRILQALNESSQALVRATDESEYLDEACRVIVDHCGYAMVWIGYAEDDEGRGVRPVASAGFEEGYLETLDITWADTERGWGPTGTALRTGRPSLCRNMLTDPSFLPWRNEALARRYASSIALPLAAGERPFGAIMIYSAEPDPFSDDEVRMLTDLAGDLARGITTLRLRAAQVRAEQERERLLTQEAALAAAARDVAQRKLAEEAANRASRYNRSLIEAAPDPLVTIGPDGKITDVNEATAGVTGLGRDELIGTDFSNYFTDPEAARVGYLEVFARGSVKDYPLTIRARDGKLTDVLYNASVYRDEEGSVLGVFAAARDITAHRQLEEQRMIASRLQQAILDIPQQVRGVEFGHLYRSATHEARVGGDFYDVFEAKGGRIALLIGDVSGHGLEAARIATLVKDIVHAFAHQFRRPHLVLRETNRLLVEKNLPGFVTVFLALLDRESATLTYSSAGHPRPLLSAEGRVEPLTSIGLPLGVFADARYRDREVVIQEGSLLLFYTDGITEARQDGTLFGEERLAAALVRERDRPLSELPSVLLEEALTFSRGSLRDDVALLAVKYLGGCD